MQMPTGTRAHAAERTIGKDWRYKPSQHFGPQPPTGTPPGATRGSPIRFCVARKICIVNFGLCTVLRPGAHTCHTACQVAGSGWPSTIADAKTTALPAFGSTRSIPKPPGQSTSGQLRMDGAEHQARVRSKTRLAR